MRNSETNQYRPGRRILATGLLGVALLAGCTDTHDTGATKSGDRQSTTTIPTRPTTTAVPDPVHRIDISSASCTVEDPKLWKLASEGLPSLKIADQVAKSLGVDPERVRLGKVGVVGCQPGISYGEVGHTFVPLPEISDTELCAVIGAKSMTGEAPQPGESFNHVMVVCPLPDEIPLGASTTASTLVA